MGKFTREEIAYLQSQRYGRLATVNQDGELHVVPVTFRYPNLATDGLQIPAMTLTDTHDFF